MTANRPAWVIKDLSTILGLDSDSIAQLVLPDLETYSTETRLKSHLQDFLGPSPQAKAFIDKYTAHRFPRLPSAPAPAPPSGPQKPSPLFSQPSAYPGSGNKASAPASASGAGSGRQTPLSANAPSTNASASASASGKASIQDALETAFGPGGRVYQKNREADDAAFGSTGGAGSGSSKHTGLSGAASPHFGGLAAPAVSGSGSRSGAGSGSHTPISQQQPMRRAGAVTITEARPKHASGGAGSERASQKGKQRKNEEDKIWDYPKSKATLKLEGLLADLKKLQEGGKVGRGKDQPEEDCFCQARLHPLSTYTPLCPSCGLTICLLTPPTLPCPSCSSPLLSPAGLSRLIMRVEDDIAAQLGREQDARDAIARKRQAAVQAEAAFPSLGGAGSGGGGGTSMSHLLGRKEEGRKVLTIGKGKGKAKSRVTLTTTTSIPTSSAAAVEDELDLDDPTDLSLYPRDIVPRPRSTPLESSRIEKELAKHLKWRAEEDRPWGDMKAVKRGEAWAYVELPIAVAYEGQGGGRRKKKGGQGQGVGGRNVPGAKPVLG